MCEKTISEQMTSDASGLLLAGVNASLDLFRLEQESVLSLMSKTFIYLFFLNLPPKFASLMAPCD